MRLQSVSTRLAATLVITGFLSSSDRVVGAPYQKIATDIPAFLPPGIKDSTLIAWGPPIAALPSAKIRADESAFIWMKITVGARGKAVSCTAIYSSHPDDKLEQAANEAVTEALFYAVWDQCSPVEYTGYYPVTFRFSPNPQIRPNRPGTTYMTEAEHVVDVIPPTTRVDLSKPASWKSLEEYVGRDAPVVTPLTDFDVEWPKKLSDSIAETTIWLKVQIRRDGTVASCIPFFFLGTTAGFDKAACEAVRKAKFPIKGSGRWSVPYDAYVAVPFVHSPEFFKSLQLPPADKAESTQQMLRPINDTVVEVLPGIYRAGISGTVRLHQLVDSSGAVLTSRLDSSSGFVEVDRLAETRGLDMSYRRSEGDGVQSPQWTSVRLCYVGQGEKTKKGKDKSLSDEGDSSNTAQGELQVLDSLPKVLKEVMAKYPKRALKNSWQGKVTVYGLVDSNGRIVRCKIAQSSGYQVLDAEAATTLLKFRLKPGMQNGKPVKCWVSKVFTFTFD